MRKPYRRRKGGRSRVIVWGSLLALVFAMTSFLGYGAIRSFTGGATWEGAWSLGTLVCMMMLCATCFVWQLRGPAEESSLPLVGPTFVRTRGPDWERFFSVTAPYVAGAVICFGFTIGLGVVPVLDLIAPELLPLDDTNARALWFVIPVPLLIAVSLTRAAVRPASLLIDRQGITLPRTSTRLRWSEIAEIRAGASHNVRGDPINDQVDIHLRDGAARVKPAPYWLQPWNELGASPTDVLDALDRFRPADVPIHDPRRITEPDGVPRVVGEAGNQ